jgi:hypothetical protein
MNQEDRIEHALDGLLGPDDWEALQREIIADDQLREMYVDRAFLHGQLRAERHTLPRLLEDDLAPLQPVSRWQPVVWAAAAAIVSALLVFNLRPANEFEPVATLAEARDCKWAGSNLPTAEGARLGTGTLALVEGMATLQFESGATVTLEAPSTLEVISKMRCRLVEGSLVADVPAPAHGFTVDTDTMEVVDHGTRFGVTASTFGNSQVLVFDGEVEVNRSGHETRRLTTGRGMHIGQSPPADQEITRATMAQDTRDGWISVPTSAGRGKDAFIRRGNPHGPTGGHPLLMVKHTDLAAGNERRMFLTFDLEGHPLDETLAAELLMDVEPSGLGFSALVPDSRFVIYGLLDDIQDEWSERDVIWESAPASLEDGLDPKHVRRLADFEILRGATPERITVSSPELLRFLKADRNRLATLIIVRETGEYEQQGLVHAFAAKEHPRALPPTLRLKPNNQP